MAIINLNYYTQTIGSNELNKNESSFYKTHSFELVVPDTMLRNGERMNKKVITGIVDQLPEIRYTTNWDISPISTVTKKISDFTENNLIRAIASNNENYRPPLFTDGWTQKMTKSGSPLSIDFTFRSYPIEIYNTTTYKEVLKFLIYITTPQEYQPTHSIRPIEDAWNQAKIAGNKIGQQTEVLINEFKKENIDVKEIATALLDKNSSLRKKFDDWLKTVEFFSSMNNDVGGAPLCYLRLGDMIKQSEGIYWMIKSWSFKPAVNTNIEIADANKYIVNPIYVDFKVSLETQQIFTNEDLKNVIT